MFAEGPGYSEDTLGAEALGIPLFIAHGHLSLGTQTSTADWRSRFGPPWPLPGRVVEPVDKAL
jgi:hypothetical protein